MRDFPLFAPSLLSLLPESSKTPLHIYIESIKNIVETIVVGGGAFWAYRNYFRDRPYKPRLETALSGRIEFDGESHYLVISVRVKNIGLAKMQIDHEGTGLRLYKPLPREDISTEMRVRWATIGSAFDILTNYDWLERDEAISQQIMIQLPREFPPSAYKLVFEIRDKTEWTEETTLTVGKDWKGGAIDSNNKGGVA